MQIMPQEVVVIARQREKENKALVARLAKMNPRELDDMVHGFHEEVFSGTDCLSCANCCRSLGPLFTGADVRRIAAHQGMKPSDFSQRYLKTDEDGDTVFKSMPCPFLGSDNLCGIYPVRPAACRDYPHTDRARFYQLLPLTLKNAHTCPAVLEILEMLKEQVKPA